MNKRFKDHPNKDFYLAWPKGALRNVADFRKSHRRTAPSMIQELCDRINATRKILDLSIRDCHFIIKHELGYPIGDHMLDFYLDEEFGVGFTPRKENTKKLEHLLKVLKKREEDLFGSSAD